MLLLLILCALRSGSDRYYLLKAQQNKIKGKEVFYFLRPSMFLKTFLFYLNYYLRKLSYLLLCFVPSAGVTVLLLFYLEYGRASLKIATVFFAFAIALFINGIIYFFRFNGFLFASRYCFALGNFSSYREIFTFSAKCVEGKRGEIIKERLRFIGWFISCILVFPVPFVQNYYRESMAGLARDLMEK